MSLRGQCEVAVVGGGVIGLCIAWRAAQRGLDVTLLDDGELAQGTSRVAAGMIAPVSEAVFTEQPLLRLGLAAAAAYPALAEELASATGLDPGYRRCGTLLVARDADEAAWLERERAIREQLGLRARHLAGSAARRLEPSLVRVRSALELEADHAVDPRSLCRALARAGAAAGAELRPHVRVEAVGHVPGGCELRLAGGARLAAKHVVIAAGVRAGEIAGLSPAVTSALRPVKGQVLRLRDPAGPGLLSRVLRLEDAYVVPRGDGRYVLGATMEERGFDRTITAGAVLELLRSAGEVLPGLSELVLEELCAGLRPGTRDNAPVLGPDEDGSLLWATGHFRHGVLLAPITAELILDWLGGRTPPGITEADLASFAPGRFAEAPGTADPFPGAVGAGGHAR